MPIVFKVNTSIDPMIQQLEFHDEPDFAVEIMSAETELMNLYGSLKGFEGSLLMSDLQPEFKIEVPVNGKVKIVGNIFEALVYLKNKNGSLGFFTPRLFLELEKNDEVSKIIKKCEIFTEDKPLPNLIGTESFEQPFTKSTLPMGFTEIFMRSSRYVEIFNDPLLTDVSISQKETEFELNFSTKSQEGAEGLADRIQRLVRLHEMSGPWLDVKASALKNYLIINGNLFNALKYSADKIISQNIIDTINSDVKAKQIIEASKGYVDIQREKIIEDSIENFPLILNENKSANVNSQVKNIEEETNEQDVATGHIKKNTTS